MEDTSHLHIEFSVDAVENPEKSRKEGRKIYDEVEQVTIKFVGDRNRELVAPAHSFSHRDRDTGEPVSYAMRFPKHYEAFKAQRKFIGDGTPLSEAPFISVAQRAELAHVNIFTIDALANVPDSIGPKLGSGWRTMVEQAKAWIDKARGNAVEMRLSAENADLRAQMEAMQAQIAQIMGGQAKPAPVARVDEDDAPTPFDGWDAETLKAYIKDRTGQAPRGNPSVKTLIGLAVQAAPPPSIQEAA